MASVHPSRSLPCTAAARSKNRITVRKRVEKSAPEAVEAQRGKGPSHWLCELRAGSATLRRAFHRAFVRSCRRPQPDHRLQVGRREGGAATRLGRGLVQLNVEVIVTNANAAVGAAKRATRTIPIVMTVPSTRWAAGSSRASRAPGADVTVWRLLRPSLPGSGSNWCANFSLVEARRGASRTNLTLVTAMQAAAQSMDFELIIQRVTKPEELPVALGRSRRAPKCSLCR